MKKEALLQQVKGDNWVASTGQVSIFAGVHPKVAKWREGMKARGILVVMMADPKVEAIEVLQVYGNVKRLTIRQVRKGAKGTTLAL